MSILSKLFGGGASAKPSVEPVEYEGFAITPEPIKEGPVYRVSATITKDVDGELKTHKLIRADTLESLDAASEASTAKARQMIDEQGIRIFT